MPLGPELLIMATVLFNSPLAVWWQKWVDPCQLWPWKRWLKHNTNMPKEDIKEQWCFYIGSFTCTVCSNHTMWGWWTMNPWHSNSTWWSKAQQPLIQCAAQHEMSNPWNNNHNNTPVHTRTKANKKVTNTANWWPLHKLQKVWKTTIHEHTHHYKIIVSTHIKYAKRINHA